jgi:hypothetical protein
MLMQNVYVESFNGAIVVGNQQCRVFGNRECREIGNTSAEFAKGIFPVAIIKKWFSDFPAYSSFRSGL